MSSLIGFLPTTNIPRVHSALTRLWRRDLGRRRLDAIFLSFPKLGYARALGWEEIGVLEEVPGGWTTADTLREFGRACDVMVLQGGDPAYYANCARAARQLGEPSWVTWQEGPAPCAPLAPGLLLSELTPANAPDYSGHGTFDDFWAAVDREQRFTWVVRLDAIGDLLLTLSHLYPFKKRYPHRRVGLVVRDRYVPWLRELDWIDAVCGVDVVHWDDLTGTAPADDGQAWLMPMPGMLRVAGNRLLGDRSGPRASAYPDSETACEYSPRRFVAVQRELLASIFDGVEPELPFPVPPRSGAGALWFSPYPGADERLWPPDCWAAALEPLAGQPIVLQVSQGATGQRWESEFLAQAARRRLRIERAAPTRTIFDLAHAMSTARGWVGINSAPMHVAALLGLPAVAVGLPWEMNAMWASPNLQIVAAERDAQTLVTAPSTKSLAAFARNLDREDGWADGLYVGPTEVAAILASSPLAD